MNRQPYQTPPRWWSPQVRRISDHHAVVTVACLLPMAFAAIGLTRSQTSVKLLNFFSPDSLDYGRFIQDLRQQVEPVLEDYRQREMVSTIYTGIMPLVYKAQRVLLNDLITSFFTAFALSSFMPTANFAMLLGALLATALVGDLVFLPAILAGPLGKSFETRIVQRAGAPTFGSPWRLDGLARSARRLARAHRSTEQ